MSFRQGFGLRNCSWPDEKWFHKLPKGVWVDQVNTMWSGVELAFASLLMYEGFPDEAITVFKTVNNRYRENGYYFDQFEFGGHYYRPMSSWTMLQAALGLSINQGVFTFSPNTNEKQLRILFAAPNGTAHFERNHLQKNKRTVINGLSGTIQMGRLQLSGFNRKEVKQLKIEKNKQRISTKNSFDENQKLAIIKFARPITVGAEDCLTVAVQAG